MLTTLSKLRSNFSCTQRVSLLICRTLQILLGSALLVKVRLQLVQDGGIRSVMLTDSHLVGSATPVVPPDKLCGQSHLKNHPRQWRNHSQTRNESISQRSGPTRLRPKVLLQAGVALASSMLISTQVVSHRVAFHRCMHHLQLSVVEPHYVGTFGSHVRSLIYHKRWTVGRQQSS